MAETKAKRRSTMKTSRKSNAEKKRLQEEETQRRRQELLTTFMKDKALRESRFGRLNSIKLNWQWRSVLRHIKEGELRSEAEAVKSSFEHLVRIKDRVISALAQEVDDSVEDRASESHLTQLDNLLGIQSEHLKKMRCSYEEHKSRTIQTLDGEMDVNRSEHEHLVFRMAKMCAGLDADAVDWENSVIGAYQSRRDEILNKGIEDEHAVRAKLGGAIDRLRQQMHELLVEYHENTDDKRRHYEHLKSRDERTSREIDEQNVKLIKLTETIGQLKRKLRVASQSGIESQLSSRKTRDRVCMEFASTTAEMERRRTENDNRLTALTVASGEAIQKLEDSIRKGRRLLRMFEVCCKYDRPGSHDGVPPRVIPVDARRQDDDQQVVLEDFWRRYTVIRVERNRAEATKRALLLDNEKLKQLLSDYLKSIVPIGDQQGVDADLKTNDSPPAAQSKLFTKNSKSDRNFRVR